MDPDDIDIEIDWDDGDPAEADVHQIITVRPPVPPEELASRIMASVPRSNPPPPDAGPPDPRQDAITLPPLASALGELESRPSRPRTDAGPPLPFDEGWDSSPAPSAPAPVLPVVPKLGPPPGDLALTLDLDLDEG